MKDICAGLRVYCGMLSLCLLFGCYQPPMEPGKKLAIEHCQSCHMLPSPEELNQQTWQREVLPKMAAKLGLIDGEWREIEVLKELHLFPDTVNLSREEWREIVAYFSKKAPPFPLSSKSILPIDKESASFIPNVPPIPSASPYISMVEYDGISHSVFFGNSADKTLTSLSLDEKTTESIALDGSPSFMSRTKEGMYVLTMGQVMPHNEKTGTLTYIPLNANQSWGEPEILLDELQRPVHASMGDLDGDGKEDMVISSFGNYRGELAWFSDYASGDLRKHILSILPGAIKSVIDDLNGDGLPDILALIAQGDEGLYMYLNQGKGKFKAKTLMRFPATYGSTYFEWKDLDGDGLKDILYVNGDNGDYFPIVKNFHGIRMYKNMGELEFEESFFLEQHGIFKAISEDFDQDGDLDIAAISYFPDYQRRPEESFVYYENQGFFNFQASTFEAIPSGKWLTMDAGDLDLDGDKDLILGSALFMALDAPSRLRGDWNRKNTPILFLSNSTLTEGNRILQ